ncbi:MAG TPA: hypothetical protein VGM89_03785, partial [Puia sp.]
PHLILDLYELFRYRVAIDTFKGGEPNKVDVAIKALEVTLGTFIIYAAPTLTRLVDRLEKPARHHDS